MMDDSLDKLNLAELKAFVLAYELGSFALVAQQLGKHASTYGRRVSNLEIDLGLELFERRGSHIVPTEHGTALYHPAKSILAEVDFFGKRVISCMDNNETEIKIAIDTGLDGCEPETAVAQLVAEFPATKIDIIKANTTHVLDLLANKSVDVGLALSCFDYPSVLVNNTLFSFEFVRVMSPEYARLQGLSLDKPIEGAAMRRLTQIVHAPLNELGITTQNYSNNLVNIDSFNTSKALIKNALGWGNVPKSQCEKELESGELVQFSATHDNSLWWTVDALWSLEKTKGVVASRFVEIFSDLNS